MKLRPVRKGDQISSRVTGGFVRVPAPDDGFVVELEDASPFIAADDVAVALSELGYSLLGPITVGVRTRASKAKKPRKLRPVR